MKQLFYLLLALSITSTILAQSTIAKLKYEQAEETFSKNDFTTTLIKLDEVQKLLGSVNPKVLYLRIMAQKGVISGGKFEYGFLDSSRKNVQYYLSHYENNAGLEDKLKDVFLFSEALEKYPKSLGEYNAQIEAQRQKEQAVKEKAERREKLLASQGGTVVYEKDAHGLVLAPINLGKLSWSI